MRIVSYNVRYFGHGLKGLASTATSKAKIAEAIRQLTPRADVIALQEVETRSLRAGVAHRGPHSNKTQLDAFMEYLGAAFAAHGETNPYDAKYFPAHAYQLGGVKFYTTGLAMLVNRDALRVIADNAREPFPITFHGSNALRKVKQTRIAAHLRLEDVRQRRFHVFNTHLSLPTPWSRAFWREEGRMGFGANQLEEAKAVTAYAHETARDEPFLMCGDFNSAPATPVYQFLTDQARLHGAQAVLKQIDPTCRDGFATAGFLRWRMHLDHVFGRGVDFLNVDDTCAFGDPKSAFHGLSDHVPLISTFDVR